MNNHFVDRKYSASLARQKRKHVLDERRFKKNRVNENSTEHNHDLNNSSYVSRHHTRQPLSDISSVFVNGHGDVSARTECVMLNSQQRRRSVGFNQCTTPTPASSPSFSCISTDTISPKQISASARQRRRSIMKRKSPQNNSHRGHLQIKLADRMPFCSPLPFDANTPLSGVTSSSSIKCKNNSYGLPTSYASSSNKHLDPNLIRSTTANLLKTFSSVTETTSTSLNTNLFRSADSVNPVQQSVADYSSDESLTDSSCEFINEDPDYDTSSSLDNDEDHSANVPTIDCTNAGMYCWNFY